MAFTYRDLKKELESLSNKDLDQEVYIFAPGVQQYFSVGEFNPTINEEIFIKSVCVLTVFP